MQIISVLSHATLVRCSQVPIQVMLRTKNVNHSEKIIYRGIFVFMGSLTTMDLWHKTMTQFWKAAFDRWGADLHVLRLYLRERASSQKIKSNCCQRHFLPKQKMTLPVCLFKSCSYIENMQTVFLETQQESPIWINQTELSWTMWWQFDSPAIPG